MHAQTMKRGEKQTQQNDNTTLITSMTSNGVLARLVAAHDSNVMRHRFPMLEFMMRAALSRNMNMI